MYIIKMWKCKQIWFWPVTHNFGSPGQW